MTDELLNAWQAIADEASPGPWEARTWDTLLPDRVRERMAVMAPPRNICTGQLAGQVARLDAMLTPESGIGDWEQTKRNAEFIALARTAVPELIAEVRRLREALQAAHKAKSKGR